MKWDSKKKQKVKMNQSLITIQKDSNGINEQIISELSKNSCSL